MIDIDFKLLQFYNYLQKGEIIMANLICAKCNQPVDEQNAVECPFCWEIYHRECWGDTENCVTCKKFNPVYEMVQAQKETESQNLQQEETEIRDKNNTVSEDDAMEFNGVEAPPSHVANTVLLASLVMLISGAAGGLALGIYMYLAGKLVVGVIGGLAIIGLGVALSFTIKGVAELVNNSQKNAFYLSKLVEKKEEKEEK